MASYGQNKKDSVQSLIQRSREKSLSHSERVYALRRAFSITQKEENDSLKLSLLSKLSLATLNRGDSILFRQTNKQTLELAKKKQDSIILAEAYWDLATFFEKNTVKDSAYYSYSEAQKIFEAKGDVFYSGRMLYNLGLQQSDVRDYVGSETTLIAAIERLKPLNKYEQLYKSYNSLAIVANELDEPDRAISYNKQALFYANKLDNSSSYKSSLKNNMGVIYRDRKNYKEAAQYFREVLAIDDLATEDPDLYAKALNNLALCKLKINDTLGVHTLIQKSIQLKDSINDIRSLASSYFTLAEYRLLENDTLSSVYNAKRAVALSKESSNNERLLETLAFLAQIDKKKCLGLCAALHRIKR